MMPTKKPYVMKTMRESVVKAAVPLMPNPTSSPSRQPRASLTNLAKPSAIALLGTSTATGSLDAPEFDWWSYTHCGTVTDLPAEGDPQLWYRSRKG